MEAAWRFCLLITLYPEATIDCCSSKQMFCNSDKNLGKKTMEELNF